MLTLESVAVGQQVRMINFQHQSQGFRHKLLAMGLTPGVLITVLRVAPLGCPMQVILRGQTVSLRKKECQQIEVEYVHQQYCLNQEVSSLNACACRQSQLRKNHAF